LERELLGRVRSKAVFLGKESVLFFMRRFHNRNLGSQDHIWKLGERNWFAEKQGLNMTGRIKAEKQSSVTNRGWRKVADTPGGF